MTCEIWVRAVESGFVATVVGLPGCSVEASTRDQAIEKARHEAVNLLSSGELVRVDLGEIPGAKERGVGIFADEDEESWNAFLAAMKEYREQVDADPNGF